MWVRTILLPFYLLAAWPTLPAAQGRDEWVLTREALGGTGRMASICHVQRRTDPPIGEVLSSHPTRKAACDAGMARSYLLGNDRSPTACGRFGRDTYLACMDEDRAQRN